MYERKKMLDRKIRWLKSMDLPNPEKEAKLTLQRQQRDEEAKKEAESAGMDMFPGPFFEAPPGDRRISDMEEKARIEELESRFRNRIREQKLENARIVKANVPSVGGAVVDPIQRHVGRRLLRQRVKIQAGLEDALHRNSAQILYEFLRGVSISIVKVRAKRPRQTQEVYYSLTSSHDPAWVQRQLEVLAPKLRSQLATKVNMGQTPNIKFVPQAASQELKREYLWQFAKKLQDETAAGGGFGSAVNVK
mmetsp:Transcript_95326/g.255943  ORF Transcript_95326/g.255943 Transcript_95326/m.255943 type:complete len:249 (+) Transcript_95326:291-1037(+)